MTSVEVNARHKEVADAGLGSRVSVLLGAALDVLPILAREVETGQRPPFDFVFIDADKENNWAYFEAVLSMVRRGTCIYVDNVVRKGMLAIEEEMRRAGEEGDRRIEGCRRLVERVGQEERVEGVVMQTVSDKNYDGFWMAVVK